jgi:hypothetical protein
VRRKSGGQVVAWGWCELPGTLTLLVDPARRVAVHRAAWHPSRVTVDSYRNVMAAWPYRATLDWVIEAPDGRVGRGALSLCLRTLAKSIAVP